MKQNSKEFSELQSNLRKEIWNKENSPYRTLEYKNKLSKARKKWWKNASPKKIEKMKKKMSKNRKGRKFTEEHKKNISMGVKKSYKRNPELLESRTKHLTKIANDYSEETSKRMKKNNPMDDYNTRMRAVINSFKSREIRPTKIEKRVTRLIKKFDFPFIYVGDGKKWINGANPDFISKELNICLEVGSKELRKYTHGDYHDYEDERIEIFGVSGWDTRFIWDDLTDEEILNELRFMQWKRFLDAFPERREKILKSAGKRC